MSAPIISVRNVSRVFRSAKKGEGFKEAMRLLVHPTFTEHSALKDIHFDIQSGEFVGLIGANGAGKTTLLKILSGLIPPSTGEASVLGIRPFDKSVAFRKQISLVMGQKAQLWWDLPALDAFDLLRAIYDIPMSDYRARLAELSQLLDVEKLLKTQIRRLSLGERMKMELIGAILHWPDVLFLDEPTIGLDLLAAHRLREFLKEFNQKRKTTVLLTSHNMQDIERLCSRILILKEGKLIYDGTPARFAGNNARQLRVRLFETPTLQEVSTACSLAPSLISECTDEEKGRTLIFEIPPEQIGHTLQALTSRYSLSDIGIEEQSLERSLQQLFEGAHS